MLLLLLFVFAVHLVPVRLWLHCRVRVADNVLAIGEEADFEALNFLLALNLMRSTNLHLST